MLRECLEKQREREGNLAMEHDESMLQAAEEAFGEQ